MQIVDEPRMGSGLLIHRLFRIRVVLYVHMHGDSRAT